VAVLDRFRAEPLDTIVEMLSKDGKDGSLEDVPRAVRLLAWLFVTGRHAPFCKRVAVKVLRLRG
jgi:hypothetical protein